MSFLDLPDDIIFCFTQFLPLKSVGYLSCVNKQCNFVIKELLKRKTEKLPWRISLEYHYDTINDIPVIHGAWAKIGWFTTSIDNQEACDYCKKHKWVRSGKCPLDEFGELNSQTHLHNREIKTTVWQGRGGEISQKLLTEYPTAHVLFEERKNILFPIDVLPYKSKRKHDSEIIDVEIGSLNPQIGSDFDSYRRKFRKFRKIITVDDDIKYECYDGVTYGDVMVL